MMFGISSRPNERNEPNPPRRNPLNVPRRLYDTGFSIGMLKKHGPHRSEF
jgi:hypothetical protein